MWSRGDDSGLIFSVKEPTEGAVARGRRAGRRKGGWLSPGAAFEEEQGIGGEPASERTRESGRGDVEWSRVALREDGDGWLEGEGGRSLLKREGSMKKK